MSREVQRVPVGWQHPTKPDPYYDPLREALRRDRPKSRLLPPGMRFVGLCSPSIGQAQREWDAEADEYARREGETWRWQVQYHLTGYELRGEWHEPVPVTIYADDGENVLWEGIVTSEDELAEKMPFERAMYGRPRAEAHMPDFDALDDELGWCLYETVSEGTPTTPVFATAEELIDHLATVGEDYDQTPYRREAAERLVGNGFSMGTMIVTGGKLYNSARDADVLAGLTDA